MIGYKLWGALLARSLKAVGDCTIVMMDYRNYPLASVPEQLEDVQAALLWTRKHIHQYGGDAEKLIVVGESAGGHLAALLLLNQALSERNKPAVEFQGPDCKGFISMATS